MLDPIKIEWQKCSTNILYLDIIYFIFLERKSGIWNVGYFNHVFEIGSKTKPSYREKRKAENLETVCAKVCPFYDRVSHSSVDSILYSFSK